MEEILVYTKAGVLVYFCLIFAGIVVWTFMKSNKKGFEEARKIPLKED
jgi:cbb3-type cytochrome oxidase subunit 3